MHRMRDLAILFAAHFLQGCESTNDAYVPDENYEVLVSGAGKIVGMGKIVGNHCQ
jgi:hypothetical protein